MENGGPNPPKSVKSRLGGRLGSSLGGLWQHLGPQAPPRSILGWFLGGFWGPFGMPFWSKNAFVGHLFLDDLVDGLFMDLGCFRSSFERFLGGQKMPKTELAEIWKTYVFLNEN